jgi:hypothetical protein
MKSNVEKSNVEESNEEKTNSEKKDEQNYKLIKKTDNIEDEINKNNIVILKFDNIQSKYNNYFHKIDLSELNLSELNFINIVDDEIIDFYGITNLPSIFVYKQRNLMDFFEGYYTQSEFIKKIKYILSN